MESLLLNGICVNLISIYCFWSYAQMRNEILLISSIHYVTKLNGQTQSVLSGDRWDSLKRRKKVSAGVVIWSEVCLAITTLMLLCSVGFRWRLLILLWTFKGDHATKFARADTAANCQVVGRWQFSARSSWGCLKDALAKCCEATETGRDWPRMVRTNRFISAPRLRMQMIRRFGRRMSVRTIRRRLLGRRVLVSASSQMS